MFSQGKEYKVDDRAKKAALFFLVCEANPATRLSIPAAMRAKGYSDVDAMNRILIQQVRHESQKNNAENSPCQKTVAAAAMLALLNKTNAVGSVLARISPIPEVSSVASGGTAGNTQLSVMGYKGDALKAQFREDKIWERQATVTFTVPQTCEHQ